MIAILDHDDATGTWELSSRNPERIISALQDELIRPIRADMRFAMPEVKLLERHIERALRNITIHKVES